MKKLKMIFTLLFTILLLITVTSCEGKKEESNKKYDISIQIKNNYESIWIFAPNVSEQTYTIEYTGEKMYFYFDSYSVPEHSILSKYWISLDDNDTIEFSTSLLKAKQMNYIDNSEYVYEKGQYCYVVDIFSNSNILKNRKVCLNINVI